MLLICSNFPLLATVVEYNCNDVNKIQGSGFVFGGVSFKAVLIFPICLLKSCERGFGEMFWGFLISEVQKLRIS